MSHYTPLLLLVFVLTTLPGCKSVVSDHLIGKPIAAEEARDYEGVWKLDDGVFHVKHTDGANLVMAVLEWDEDGFEVNELDMIVTGHGEARFLQVVEEEKEEGVDEDEHADDEAEDDDDQDNAVKPWIVLGLVTSSEDHALVISAPDFDRFVKALDAGAIKGELEKDGNTLHIRGEKAELDALIVPDRLHELFRLQQPVVITRIGDLE